MVVDEQRYWYFVWRDDLSDRYFVGMFPTEEEADKVALSYLTEEFLKHREYLAKVRSRNPDHPSYFGVHTVVERLLPPFDRVFLTRYEVSDYGGDEIISASFDNDGDRWVYETVSYL